MKYAIFADVHGNAPALHLALEDARTAGAKRFIFAGDYCVGAPWPDEVVSMLYDVPDKWIVCGNEEKYLHWEDGDDGQFEAARWCRETVSSTHRDWLDTLPERLDFESEGLDFHIAHSSSAFIGNAEHGRFSSRKMYERYAAAEMNREEFLCDLRMLFSSDSQLKETLHEMPKGVYIFGHTHVQWHLEMEDSLLINPGSCGIPLDGFGFCVPYTLLTVEHNRITVEERRLALDAETLIAAAKQTTQYEAAWVWSELIFTQWRTSYEVMRYFLEFADQYARRIGDDRRPYAKDTWHNAFLAWRAKKAENDLYIHRI